MDHFSTDVVNKWCVSPSFLSKAAISIEWDPSHIEDGRATRQKDPGCLNHCVEEGHPDRNASSGL